MEERETHLAGAAGLVFVVLGAVGSFLPGAPPAVDKPIGEITRYFVANDTKIILGTLMTGVGAIFVVMFGWGLLRLIRRHDPENSLVSLGMIGLAATGGAVQVFTVVGVIPSWESARGLAAPSDAIVRFVYDSQLLGFALTGVLLAVFLGATSMAIIRSGVMAAWVGWLGIVCGLAAVAASTALLSVPMATAGLFLVFMPFLAWIVVTSIMMLRPLPATESRMPRAAAPAA